MGKIKVLALCGKSGAGKDYIQDWIVKNIPNVHKVVPFTTRPKREGEVEGEAYHFINDGDLKDVSPLTFATYRGWSYGTRPEDYDEDKINVGVFNLIGIEMLQSRKEYEVLPVYIYAHDKVRLERCLNREENPNCYEICRRFITDERDFQRLNEWNYVIFENCIDRDIINIHNIPRVKSFLGLD